MASASRPSCAQEHGIPCFFMDSGLTTKDYGWGTYAFRQLGLHKVKLVLELAKTGVDALTVDADAFVLRDPFPYFRRLPNADVLTSSDHLSATHGIDDDGLEGGMGFGSAFNIGCAHGRPLPRRAPPRQLAHAASVWRQVHLHTRACGRVCAEVARHMLRAEERLGPGAQSARHQSCIVT